MSMVCNCEKPRHEGKYLTVVVKWFLCLAIALLITWGFFDFKNKSVKYKTIPMNLFTEGIE